MAAGARLQFFFVCRLPPSGVGTSSFRVLAGWGFKTRPASGFITTMVSSLTGFRLTNGRTRPIQGFFPAPKAGSGRSFGPPQEIISGGSVLQLGILARALRLKRTDRECLVIARWPRVGWTQMVRRKPPPRGVAPS